MFEAFKKGYEVLRKGFNFFDRSFEKLKLWLEKQKKESDIKANFSLKRLGLSVAIGAYDIAAAPFRALKKLLGFGKEIDFEGEVIKNIKKKLDSEQLENASIIEKVFRDAGMPDSVIAAAIVNAYAESNLRAGVTGDSGHSVGLFQLHDRGGGSGMSVEERQDPEINAKTILEREVLAEKGQELLAKAKSGASVAELSAIFSRDIERPRDKEGAMARREKLAEDMFGEKEIDNEATI
jgi:hypothetical protein